MFGQKLSFIKVIGKGGFGTVYLAEVEDNNHFRQRIAVKLLHDKYQEISQAVARHQDEARLLGLLNHDNIVKVYDLGKLNGQPAVFMEYVEGVTLSQLLKQQPIPAKVAFEIGADCASALYSAFSSVHPKTNQPLCVIHRDIKPSNILLSKSGVVKILDFGIARANFDRESRTQTNQLGTERYMAPEQWLEQSSTDKVDIYALGFSMLELLTGRLIQRLPLDSEYHQRVLEKHLLALPKVPNEGRNVLRKMLAFDATDRPDAKAVREACLSISERLNGANVHLYARESVPSLLQEQEDSVTHIPLPDTSMVVQTYVPRKTNLFWPLVALGLALFAVLPNLLSTNSSPPPSVTPVPLMSTTVSKLPSAAPTTVEPSPPVTASARPQKAKRAASRPTKSPENDPAPILHPVSFSSIPLGAEVFVDGTRIGTTLVNQIKLSQGTHSIEMVWGEQRLKKTIQLDSEQLQRFVWTVQDNQWSSYLD